MRKVLRFNSPSAPYFANATVLCCFDRRFHSAIEEFLRTQQILMADMIIIAGGSKTLASPHRELEREFVLEQIRLSITLHGAKRIILANHSDCGAYGGLTAFQSNTEIEAEHHAQELQAAANLVRKIFPTATVQAYFMNFEGVFRLPNPT